MNVNVDFMRKTLIQVNGGIAINVDVSVKNVIFAKQITSAILPHEVGKMENI